MQHDTHRKIGTRSSTDVVVRVPPADAPAIEQLSDDERTVALCSGAACLRQNRKMLAGATERQMYAEIEGGFRAQLDAQAAALALEKTLGEERHHAANDRLDKEVDTVVRHKTELLDRVLGDKEDQVRRLTDLLRDRDLALLESKEALRQQASDRRAKMDEEVAAAVRQHDQMRDGALREVLAKNAAALDGVQKHQRHTRTSTEIGAIGEQQFIGIAEKAFVDFEGFRLLDVHAQPHKGDAHIVIKDLTIMVDAKAYSRRVDSSQIEKIKADLRCNEHIPFAWLVSLNTGIDCKDGRVFSFEWIGETQCVVYVNNLLSHSEPGLLLKTLYYLCRDQLARVRAAGDDDGADARELASLREARRQTAEKLNALKKRLREVKSAMTGLRNLYADLERDVAGLLNAVSEEGLGATGPGLHKHYASVSEWWSGYAECVDGSEGDVFVLKSTSLWMQLKRDRSDICAEMTVTEFKDVLCLIVPAVNVVRARGKGGGVDVLRYRVRPVAAEKTSVVVATECLVAASPSSPVTSKQSC
jgi:hypothetical protein